MTNRCSREKMQATDVELAFLKMAGKNNVLRPKCIKARISP